MWFFSLVDFEFWFSGQDVSQHNFNLRISRIARELAKGSIYDSNSGPGCFHFFTSNIVQFEQWSDECQRFFLVLLEYHLPNVSDILLEDTWRKQIKHLFVSSIDGWTPDNFMNIQNLVTTSDKYIINNMGIGVTPDDRSGQNSTTKKLRNIRTIAPRDNHNDTCML